jgi:hypothetical protein
MDDPEDLDPLILDEDAVEHHVLTRDQVPQARCNVIAGHSRLGVPGKLFPPLRDRIEDTIRSTGVFFGLMHPDGDQIAMVARRLGPLSMPSCTISRSSSAV